MFSGLVEQAFAGEPCLELLERQLQRADPLGLNAVQDDLILSPRLIDGEPATTMMHIPSCRVNFRRTALERNSTARIWLNSSFSVQYTCPDPGMRSWTPLLQARDREIVIRWTSGAGR